MHKSTPKQSKKKNQKIYFPSPILKTNIVLNVKTKFVSFDASPPPERPPADDEDHEEERLEEVGQGHEEEDQDEGMDGGDE